MSDQQWNDNIVQFPRLLAEILAVGLLPYQYHDIAASMDLTTDEVDELFERAECVWLNSIDSPCPYHTERVFGCPDPDALYVHCAKCGMDLMLDNGEARLIVSGLCPECGSEDIIEQEGD